MGGRTVIKRSNLRGPASSAPLKRAQSGAPSGFICSPCTRVAAVRPKRSKQLDCSSSASSFCGNGL
eukprot:6146090-Prymnesium_polylepis.1